MILERSIKSVMDNNMKLEQFLVKAKMHTYASSGEGGERDLEDGSKELIYEEGDWQYRDRYFGFNPFIGEEVVWKNGKVVWVMNYCGRVLSEDVSAKEVYEFLKKAMRQVKEDRPFRGPTEFLEGGFRYADKNDGSAEDFSGIENIYFQDGKVYELRYHGGTVDK